MLQTIISSKTRIKLLLRFFLNPESKGYLRSLESEFKEGSNSIRLELNKFEEAGLLQSTFRGNKKFYSANTNHPLYPNLHDIVFKYIGLDQIISEVVQRLGGLKQVFILGDYAKGLDSGVIDLLFVGRDLDISYLVKLIGIAEKHINRKIRYINFNTIQELSTPLERQDHLLIWEN